MNLRLQSLHGAEIAQHIDALAALRIAVFREWPYLYEGTREYETRYLQTYLKCRRSLAILVWDGTVCVGASTVQPLADAPSDMQQPFIDTGMDLSRIDYFGESVLLQAYRGKGLGVKFFEVREAHAKSLGLPICAFCAVQRNDKDPRRPANYVANDAFWRKRGYRKQNDLQTSLSWPDLGETASSNKPMTFWTREFA
jgi:GNAT superfamily N-acetyltransferase